MVRRRKIVRRRPIKRRRMMRVRNPGGHPPVIQQGRWYNGIAQATGTSTTAVTVNSVANSFRDFYGLYATDSTNRIPIKIRFRFIKVWQLLTATASNGTSKVTPIYITCNSLVDASSTQEDLYNAYNYPAKNQFARVGFRWPSPHNRTVFDDSQVSTQVAKIVADTGAAYVYHVGISWRPENGGGVTLLENFFTNHDPDSPFTMMQ